MMSRVKSKDPAVVMTVSVPTSVKQRLQELFFKGELSYVMTEAAKECISKRESDLRKLGRIK